MGLLSSSILYFLTVNLNNLGSYICCHIECQEFTPIMGFLSSPMLNSVTLNANKFCLLWSSFSHQPQEVRLYLQHYPFRALLYSMIEESLLVCWLTLWSIYLIKISVHQRSTCCPPHWFFNLLITKVESSQWCYADSPPMLCLMCPLKIISTLFIGFMHLVPWHCISCPSKLQGLIPDNFITKVLPEKLAYIPWTLMPSLKTLLSSCSKSIFQEKWLNLSARKVYTLAKLIAMEILIIYFQFSDI